MSFDEWMKQVNSEVMAIVGLSCDDLPDCLYWDNWDNGTSPQEMAREVIYNAQDSVMCYFDF